MGHRAVHPTIDARMDELLTQTLPLHIASAQAPARYHWLIEQRLALFGIPIPVGLDESEPAAVDQTMTSPDAPASCPSN
jgi:hypothetical protein